MWYDSFSIHRDLLYHWMIGKQCRRAVARVEPMNVFSNTNLLFRRHPWVVTADGEMIATFSSKKSKNIQYIILAWTHHKYSREYIRPLRNFLMNLQGRISRIAWHKMSHCLCSQSNLLLSSTWPQKNVSESLDFHLRFPCSYKKCGNFVINGIMVNGLGFSASFEVIFTFKK